MTEILDITDLANAIGAKVVEPEESEDLDHDHGLVGVRAEKCRRRLANFVRYGWNVLEPGTPLEWSWHHDALCDHIQALLKSWARGEEFDDQNIVINVPPGSLKSRILSVYAPAWAWVHWPHWKTICLSANPTVAQRDARLSRELLQSEWYQEHFEPKWNFKDDQDAVSNFGNTAGGTRQSKGLNAKITGERADAIFIDDPHDAHEAMSDRKRTEVVARYKTSVHNRVNDERRAVRVLIMQRLHEGDLSGALLEGDDWDHLKLPTEYSSKSQCLCQSCKRGSTNLGFIDPRTEEGKCIHPARFTAKFIARERVRLGAYGYAGQHDQAPAPIDGGLFKRSWWKWCDPSTLPEKYDRLLISVDASLGSVKDTASRNAIGAIGQVGTARYMLEVDARVGGLTETITRIKDMRKRWPATTCVLVELKANGQSVIDALLKEFPDIVSYNPKQDSKLARAMAIQPQVEAGSVVLSRGPWNDEFLHELSIFPNGKHDDQVDMLSQALIYMGGSTHAMRLMAAYG